MRSDGLRLYTIRPFKIPDESRVNMHMFDIEGAGGVTMQGTLSADRIIASGAIETAEGLKVGAGGILLAGPSDNSHTITSLGTINLDTPDVTIRADLSVGEGITASGLTIDHGPATISGAAIATEPYVDSELTSLSGILQSQITDADLDFQGDTGGALNITGGETLTISGGTNIHTAGSGNVLTVNTDDDLIASSLTINTLSGLHFTQGEGRITEEGSDPPPTPGFPQPLDINAKYFVRINSTLQTGSLHVSGTNMYGHDLSLTGDFDIEGEILADGKIRSNTKLEAPDLLVWNSGVIVDLTVGSTSAGAITTSGLAVEHGPATISGLTIATEAYADQVLANALESEMSYKGGYDAATNSPDLDTTPGTIAKGDVYTVTAAGVFFDEDVEAGDVLIAEIASASGIAD